MSNDVHELLAEDDHGSTYSTYRDCQQIDFHDSALKLAGGPKAHASISVRRMLLAGNEALSVPGH